MLGAHMSIAGGMFNALLAAEKFHCDTVQVFTRNQQQWKAAPLSPEAIAEWKSHLQRLGLKRTVAHGSYLINLASPDEELWRKSIEAFLDELNRCDQLGIDYFVIHPGAHSGAGIDQGIARVAAALDVIYQMLPTKVITCLEGTAGQGSTIGHKLQHLLRIIELTKRPDALGVCLDTAHLFAAGYDIRGEGYAALQKEIRATFGIEKLKVMHLNDSKMPLGSHVDRHEHIGKGKIGLEGFKPIMGDPRMQKIPKILETPKGKGPRGREWDAINLGTLRKLAAK